MNKGSLRGVKIRIKVIKIVGSEPNYLRALNETK